MRKILQQRKFFLFITLSICLLNCSCKQYPLGIKKGEGFLTKSLFLKEDIQHSIKTIQVLNDRISHDKKIIILGSANGYIIESETQTIVKALHFKHTIGVRPEVLLLLPNNNVIIIKRGGGFGDVGLVNTDGNFIWKYKKIGVTTEMINGDLDNDGKPEFYVTDVDGLKRLDEYGKQIWKVSGGWQHKISIYEPTSTHIPLIATLGDDNKIRFWDNTGKLVREIFPERHIHTFELVKWLDNFYIISEESPYILIMDLDGKVIFFGKQEVNARINDIRAVSVRLDIKAKPYLAVLSNFQSSIGKAMLSVFSPEGEIMYQELLNSTTGLAILPEDDESESLLVGDGSNIVWKYIKK